MTTGSSRARAPGRAAAKPGIDREKLAAAVECLNDAAARALLSECLSLLPDYKVAEVVRGYVDPWRLRPDAAGPDGMRSVLHDVRAFDAASRSGEYYESFDVNSRNFMEESEGTKAFIAECNLLFGRCVRSAPSGEAQDACEAFETLFEILLLIDEANDDIVFFADEGGSWQVAVDWGTVLPAWFGCLSKVADADDYARRVIATVDAFEEHARDRHLATAAKVGTAAQREAIARCRGANGTNK